MWREKRLMAIEMFSMEGWFVFLVILARMGAIISSLPIFTSAQGAVRLRVGLSVTISMLLFPVLDISLTEQQMAPVPFGLLIAKETLLGLLIGLVSQLIFFAVQFGATIVGYQMGFAAANILDPQHQQQVPLLSQFQNVFAILLFLALDIHHLILRVMVRSYEILAPGGIDLSGEAIPYVMEMAGEMFVLGIQLVAPIMITLMLSMFVLGILSRVFSQLQVFMLSFPINISLALIIIGLSMERLVTLLEQEFEFLQERILHLLHLV